MNIISALPLLGEITLIPACPALPDDGSAEKSKPATPPRPALLILS